MIDTEKAIPIATSDLISLISDFVIAGLPYPISLILPLCTSSSTSSEVCQKKRHGDIVVPKIATNIMTKSESNSMCGINVARSISYQFPPTITAVIMYANKERVRYFRSLEYFLYGIRISAARITPTKVKVAIMNGMFGNTNLIDADMAPISAPMFIILAMRRSVTSGIYKVL